MRNTLLLSDIHLGDPDFIYADELDLLLTTVQWAAVFIVGDFLDTWESTLDEILDKFRGLIGVINEVSRKTPVIIIKGNHDPDEHILQNIFPFSTVHADEANYRIGGYSCVLCHGDKVDPAGWYLKFLFDFHKWLLKTFGKESWIYRAASWIRERFYNIPKKPWAVQDKNAVNRWGNLPGINAIIVGHTHAAKMLQTTTITYLNLGMLLFPLPTYAIHDGATDKFKLLRLMK